MPLRGISRIISPMRKTVTVQPSGTEQADPYAGINQPAPFPMTELLEKKTKELV